MYPEMSATRSPYQVGGAGPLTADRSRYGKHRPVSVHRLAKYQTDDPFTRVPNTAVNDERLDLRARGLLLFMLSKPDGWTFRERVLAKQAGVGRDQVRSAIATLIEAGYVRRRWEAQPDGPPVMVTEVFDCAQEPEVGLPEVGNPDRREALPISNEALVVTKESSKATTKRLTSMTADWTPDPTNLEALKAKHRTLNVTAELEQFRDHWISKGERRADWNASLRTWMRNAERWAVRYEKPGTGHAGSRKVAPDRCPDCAQLLDEHDEQVHDLLIGRI